jgi:hypothetical protein
MIGYTRPSVVNPNVAEEQPQILRLRKPQKTRLAALMMTAYLRNGFLWNGFFTTWWICNAFLLGFSMTHFFSVSRQQFEHTK